MIGNNVMAIESDLIDIREDDPKPTRIDSLCNDLDRSKPKSASGNSLFDGNHRNSKALSKGDLRSPLGPTLENFSPENDFISSAVLESDTLMGTNASDHVTKMENKSIIKFKKKVSKLIKKCFPKIIKPSVKSLASTDEAPKLLEFLCFRNEPIAKVSSMLEDECKAIKQMHAAHNADIIKCFNANVKDEYGILPLATQEM